MRADGYDKVDRRRRATATTENRGKPVFVHVMKTSIRSVVAIILFHATTTVTSAAVVVHAELDDDRNDIISSGDDNNVEVIVSAVIEEGDDDVSVSHSSLSLDEDSQYHDPDESSAPLTSSPVDENSIANNEHYIHNEKKNSNENNKNKNRQEEEPYEDAEEE